MIRNNKHTKNIVILLFVAVVSRIIFFVVSYKYMKGINFPYGLCQWDCGWYLSIIQNGYDSVPHGYQYGNAANWPFFPLFPTIVYLFKILIPVNSIIASLIINNSIFLLFIILLYFYMETLVDYKRALNGVLAFCFFPFTLYLSVPYTEALYLTLLLVGIISLKKRNYLVAIMAGIFLSVTRNGGIFFLLIFISFYINDIKIIYADKEKRIAKIRYMIIGVLFMPILLELFSLYLYYKTGDGLAFIHIQKGYGRDVGSNPISTIINIYNNPDPYTVYCLFAMIMGVIASVWLNKRENIAISIFSVIPIYLTLSTGNIASMSRYSFLSVSFIALIVYLFSAIKMQYYILGIIGMGTAYIIFIYFWVNGYSFMI
jgi:hypothetical protein